jgi:GTP-binding protein
VFVDQVQVKLKAGKGGDGCVSFRREYRVPRGGPDGGHGGNGGSIYFVSGASIHSLAYFRFRPVLKAKNGAPGEGSNKYGKRGSDLRLPVPVGTVVREEGKEGVLFDFVLPGRLIWPPRAEKEGGATPLMPRPLTRPPGNGNPGGRGKKTSSSSSSSSSPTSALSVSPTPANPP